MFGFHAARINMKKWTFAFAFAFGRLEISKNSLVHPIRQKAQTESDMWVTLLLALGPLRTLKIFIQSGPRDSILFGRKEREAPLTSVVSFSDHTTDSATHRPQSRQADLQGRGSGRDQLFHSEQGPNHQCIHYNGNEPILRPRSRTPSFLPLISVCLTSPGVDDEIDGGVEGEEEVRERDDPLYERGNGAVVLFSAGAALRAPPAIDDLVKVRHNFGRLAEDEEQRDEDQDAGQVVLAHLAAGWTFLACLRLEKRNDSADGRVNSSGPPDLPLPKE